MVQSVSPRGGRPIKAPIPPNDQGPLRRARRSSIRVRSRRHVSTLPLDLILLVAASIGLIVASYLAFVDVTGGSTLCFAGSACDVVRASSYGRLAGLPVALLGVLYFGAVVAASTIKPLRRPAVLHLLGGVGLGAAVVFVGLQAVVIQAWCPYCLVADAAAIVIGVRALSLRAPGRIGRVMVGAALAMAVLLLGYGFSPATPSTATTSAATSASGSTAAGAMSQDQLAALADHLRDTGAVFYGTYWCPHCQNQKRMFGAAASRLPYVECDPGGSNAQPAACQAAGVKAYPTWIVNGQRIEGEVQPAELARLSGFQP
jgi:uncharacterized membrane protein/glutaredoxin